MTTLPAEVTYGHVVGRFLLAVADGTDSDRMPDAVPASGTITFKPKNIVQRTATEPATIIRADVKCTVGNDGWLVDPRNSEGVWLTVGRYDVVFQFTGAILAGFEIEVTNAHTLASPLDLTTAAPLTPTPQQTLVTVQLPSGGTDGQVLTKDGSASYATEWRNPSGGSGSNTVTSVLLTTANQAISLPASPAKGDVVTLILMQDDTGGRTVSWPNSIAWESGTEPSLSTVPGSRDVFSFLRDDTDWLGFVSGAFGSPPDTTAPAMPTGLTTSIVNVDTVVLNWNASSDDTGVTGYEYRINGGAAIDAGAGTTEQVVGLTAGSTYTFAVRAYDAAGNRSVWSSSVDATIPTPSAWEAEVSSLNPGLWWRLGEPSGTFADWSGNEREGTLSGSASARDVASLIPSDTDDGALRLGGAGKVYIPSGETTWMNSLTYTIIVTVKAAAAAAEQHIVTRSPNVFHLALANTGVAKMGVYGSSSVGDMVGVTNVRDNATHLIVVTVTAAGDHALYVDGVVEDTLTGHVPVSPTTEFAVGNRGGAGTHWYSGDVDEVVYLAGTALTNTQVTDLYNAWQGV